jgi:dephospho-CoA kinase
MVNEKKIVATVGLCGSGKSVVGDYLEKKGCSKIYFGTLTLEEVKKRGLELTEENERKVREELRQEYGMGAYATLNLSKIEERLKKGDKVLIDGLYSFAEYKILKEKYNGSLFILAVFTPRELRYERLSKRKHRSLTRYEAVSRDYAEIENIQKGGPIAMADHTLINDSTIEDLLHKLDKIMIQEKFF